jgi:hypothetical protein
MAKETSCNYTQKVPADIQPIITATGEAVDIEAGTLKLEILSGDGAFNVIDDKHIELISGNDVGDTSYKMTGDADLGEGVQLIEEILILHVVHPTADAFGVSFGTPVPK